MNEKQELLEYLGVLEMKLASLQRDIRNIRGRLEDCELVRKQEQKPLNFFTACKSEDDDFLDAAKRGFAPQEQ
jgi:hypothetical protein